MAGMAVEDATPVQSEDMNGPDKNHQNQIQHGQYRGGGGGGGGYRGGGRGGRGRGGSRFQDRNDGRGMRSQEDIPDLRTINSEIVSGMAVEDTTAAQGEDMNGPDKSHQMGHGQYRGGGGGGYRGGGGGGFRGGRGGRGGGGGRFQGRDDGRGMRNQEDRLNERLQSLSAPTHDLPPSEIKEKKFTGRCRLYIGNLTPDVTEEELTELFKAYGETAELFVNKEKNFSFIRMDYRVNAEKAKRELDGSIRKGRPLKVRFAPHSAAIKVKNLTQWVSNELLEKAFGVFGEIERAIVVVDDRGKSTGEGIVEFARKPGAQMALKRCSDGCFFLTSALRPVVVEPYEEMDDQDGYQEKNLPKKHQEYVKARELGPRFAIPGSFEHEYGQRWKQLYEMRKQKEDALKREICLEDEKLEAQMEYARYEHETELLREQLRQRELDRERQKREWEMKERQRDDQLRQEEELRLHQQEEMTMRMRQQEEELRRRQQENSLFMQEQAMGAGNYGDTGDLTTRGGYDSPGAALTATGSMPPDPKAFMDAYDQRRYEQGGAQAARDMRGGQAGMDEMEMAGTMGGGRGQWGRTDRRPGDDYQAKRRRY